MRVLRHLTGHVGDSVSALVDGQLSAEEEERVWSHVLTCPGCRRLVEHEGWTKSRLRALSGHDPQGAPAALLGELYAVEAWATVDHLERTSRRRRAAVAVVGAGSLGAAVLGIVGATTAPAGRHEVPGMPPTPASLQSSVVGPGLISGVVGSTVGAIVGSDVQPRDGATTGTVPAGRRTAR